jgi:hypothetical protein
MWQANLRLLKQVLTSVEVQEVLLYNTTVRSESRCALIKVVGCDVHEPQFIKTELNNYSLYRYCTTTAV